MEFIWPIRVYYEDTDAGGVVYYANYLKYFERARSEWLNALGIDQAKLLDDNVAFAVKKAEVDYIKPARLNQSLQVKSQITELGGASLKFEQELTTQQDPNQVLCRGVIEVVCLKLPSFTPCRIPAFIKKELQRVC